MAGDIFVWFLVGGVMFLVGKRFQSILSGGCGGCGCGGGGCEQASTTGSPLAADKNKKERRNMA